MNRVCESNVLSGATQIGPQQLKTVCEMEGENWNALDETQK